MPRIILDTTRNLDNSDILEILLENGICECQLCGTLEQEDCTSQVYNGDFSSLRNADAETWCESCADDADICSSCGERWHNDYTSSTSWGERLCNVCYTHGEYFACEGCSEIFSTDNMAGYEHGCFCEGCSPEETDDDDDDDAPETLGTHPGCGLGGYHEDSIRSNWIIPSGAVSVEIELKTKHRNKVANALRHLYGCACERDGSLDDSQGMEIITMPELYPEILKTVSDMLQSIQTMQTASAWNCGKGYGIHVNLDARQWSETKRAAYCAQFGASNRQWLELVAGREENHWAKYKTDDSETTPTDKYSACALKSGGRMEIRIFRSTLKPETALGYVSLSKDIERFVDCDLFRRPKDLLFWLVRNGSKETRWLLGSKIPGQILSALLPPKSFESFLVNAGIEVGQN